MWINTTLKKPNMLQLAKIMNSDEAPISYVTPDLQDWYGMVLPKQEIFTEVYETFQEDMFVGIRFLKRSAQGNLNLLGGQSVLK